ncbi:histidine kinase [Pseudolysobacter antarcticus]|uniref:histidine kinase n=1 Tax=Pseudolysobacter antarcticus TaxID=2511995 RepID=A0A411HF44_9GAMM|nr:ATP-binding protein [Pseudolysobacter antarcticus]QBB69102.1 histidine kinase [Pseudolysobacter antarcticus]
MSNRSWRWNYESRILLGALFATLPALIALAAALWLATNDVTRTVAIWGGVAVLTIGLSIVVRRNAVYPLYTLSNLLEALREGDYSLRGSRARRGDAIGEVVLEINALAQTLREQRLAVEEKSALLAKVIATLDIAVLAFDADGHIKLANPAAERLLAANANELAAQTALSLGLQDCLAITDVRVLERSFASGSGRWEVRHARFRENSRSHDLLVISDLSRALREEERLAWQRLLRVLGHELNNSLAPIRSMAGTLSKLTDREPLPDDWREDVQGGLRVIGARAEALARFMARYTQLARLPPPSPRAIEFGALAHRAALLEQRVVVSIDAGPALQLDVDPDQIEQALINLIKNAADAALDGGARVSLRWRRNDAELHIEVIDDGPGLPPSENLFVPFFTTKPDGSGIGLVLARQIIEAHGGTLTLENRHDARGCIARLHLPAPAL